MAVVAPRFRIATPSDIGAILRLMAAHYGLTLFDATRVEKTLEKMGFRCRKLTTIGGFALLPGWVAFEAVKP